MPGWVRPLRTDDSKRARDQGPPQEPLTLGTNTSMVCGEQDPVHWADRKRRMCCSGWGLRLGTRGATGCSALNPYSRAVMGWSAYKR